MLVYMTDLFRHPTQDGYVLLVGGNNLTIVAVEVTRIESRPVYTLGSDFPVDMQERRTYYYTPLCKYCKGYLKFLSGVTVCEGCERVLDNPVEYMERNGEPALV